MKSWSSTSKSQEPGSESQSPGSGSPVWVPHTPPPPSIADDNDTESTGRTSSTPPYAGTENRSGMKGRLRSLLPQSWSSFKQKKPKESDSESTGIQILPNGTRVSPPVSPLLGRRTWNGSQGDSSNNSHKALFTSYQDALDESILTSLHPAEHYAEKLEVYRLKYSYLKSWPGLLRLLAGLQLLFGGMVVACVIAYVHKDSEWSNSYGLYNGVYNNGMGVSGYSYNGPMTPFVLAVAGISWILTVCLLVVGMTMYYRTILLDSPWWPLTEAFINMALFLLYMAAGIVYLNDLNRGGLCYMTIGVNPMLANLCRVDGGQMAGTAFIFINMTLYLGSFLVCLKMWRHEATRRERECFGNQEEFHRSIQLTPQRPQHISSRDEADTPSTKKSSNQASFPSEDHGRESSYIPKVHIVADYIMKYPEINSVEERDKYRAVFNDQYQEYKDLHRDICSTLNKFRELEAMMERLPREGKTLQEKQRIGSILLKLQQKKSDPIFLEKKQRCDYLKAKLSHIKNKIQTFDQETTANG